MEEILETLIQRILAEMPEIAYVSEDCGHLEMLQEMERSDYPFALPAVLVDCSGAQWSGVKGLSQKGTVTVKTKLLTDCYVEVLSGTPEPAAVRQRGALQKRLHEVVQGFRAAEAAHGLMRSEAETRLYKHGVKVYETSYEDTLNVFLSEGGTTTPVERIQLAVSQIS